MGDLLFSLNKLQNNPILSFPQYFNTVYKGKPNKIHFKKSFVLKGLYGCFKTDGKVLEITILYDKLHYCKYFSHFFRHNTKLKIAPFFFCKIMCIDVLKWKVNTNCMVFINWMETAWQQSLYLLFSTNYFLQP